MGWCFMKNSNPQGLVDLAGGVLVTKDVDMKNNGFGTVTMEQIVQWDPEGRDSWQEGHMIVGAAETIISEESLKNIYNTQLHLIYIEQIKRITCVAGNIK